MSVGPAALSPQGGLGEPSGRETSPWRSPLVPAALAFTVGILLDRQAAVPLVGSLFASLVCLLAWLGSRCGRSPGLPLVYLALALVGLGAAWHHYRRDARRPDDVGWLVGESFRIVQVRGRLDQEPVQHQRPRDDPLFSFRPGSEASFVTTAIVDLSKIRARDDWLPVTGKVQLACGPVSELHAGDEIDVVGRLEPLPGPENPGERDRAGELRDQGIRAVLRVQGSAEAIVRLERASPGSLRAILSRVRGWGVQSLQKHLDERQASLAAALLLGEYGRMPLQEWERYVQSGVVHVLVVSGQHLVILAGFLWFCLRFVRLRQRTGVLLIILILWGYALIAGGRPSVLRAATTVTVFGGGLLLRRPVLTLNALGAAWLFVLLLNPADVHNLGCLLSFACIAVLYWIHLRSQEREAVDPLDQLLEESRPWWSRALRGLGRFILTSYLLTLVLWLATTPLIVNRLHFVPLAALLIGPPVVWLATLALVTGFLLFLLPPLAPLLAWALSLFLAGCDGLVSVGVGLWQRQGYVPGLPEWWLIGYYLLLSAVLMLPGMGWRVRRPIILAGLAWGCVLLVTTLHRPGGDELRVTFLSVGHGGCTVLETPDGRVLLYDAGSMRGPGVARSRIAPFLWSRGISRIDEVFLSHADLDHFNGLRDLLLRFRVGQITCTPTFDQKDNRPVREVAAAIERSGVPVRIVRLGDRLLAGPVSLDVFHPPDVGPEGNENARSLVLLVSHGRHRLLLTGDLEGLGMEEVARRPPPADVLMAPHHGSSRVQARALVQRTRPSLIVASQGVRPDSKVPTDYLVPGVSYLGTWPHGAITIRSHSAGLVAETFVSRKRLVLRPAQLD